jgi:hypothetical protein
MYYDLWEWQWPDLKKIAGLNNNDKHLSVIEGEIKNTRTWFQSQKYIFGARKIYLNVTDNSLNEFEMQIAQDEARSVSNAVN